MVQQVKNLMLSLQQHGNCCVTGLIPGPGTSMGVAKKEKKKKAMAIQCLDSSIFVFLPRYLQYMEILRLEVKSEVQMPVYTTATATPDWSCIFDLCCGLWQCQILNPLS